MIRIDAAREFVPGVLSPTNRTWKQDLVAVSRGRPRAQPRADRERRRAVPRRVGPRLDHRAERLARHRLGPGRDRVPRADVLALPRPHPQLAVQLAEGQQPLGLPARLPPLHALPLVAAPAQPPSRAHRQPRQARAGRDLHDDRSPSTRARLALRRLGYRALPQPAADAVRRAEPRLPVRAPLPAAGHVPEDPLQRGGDEPRAGGLGDRLERARRLADLPAHPGHDAGGRRGRSPPGCSTSSTSTRTPTTRPPASGSFELAALQGSSYLELPRPLAWAVGNANYHHVHHLSAKIPNYHLRAAHEEQPMFARTPVVTVRSSIAALRLKLWDEERGCLVRWPPARRTARAGRVCSSPVAAR